jgi:Uma2 family endonuclease
MVTLAPQKTERDIERYFPPAQGDWTYDDYARLPDNGARYEVIRGELFMSPAPRPVHQEISGNLFAEIHFFLRKHKLGRVYSAPIDLVLEEIATPVQPDIVYIPQNKLDMIKDIRIEGTPDLVVEIISPSSVRHDRHNKFYLYLEAGVSEYWLIDPTEKTVEIYVLRGEAYALLGSFGLKDEAYSEVLQGFSVMVSDIFEE